MKNIRVAYFAEVFPSKSETWIHHEINQLMQTGCDVRVFATHARPKEVPLELNNLEAITTYLTEFNKSLLGPLRVFCSPTILRYVILGIFSDCPRIRLKAQVLRDIVYAGFFWSRLTDFNPHFMIVHFGATRANLALIWSLLTGTPFSIKFHALDVFDRVALLRLKVKHAALLTTISSYNMLFLRENYQDIDVSQFKIHKCGIAISAYPFQPKSSSITSPTIISVGRLVWEKAFHNLLYASRHLLDTGFSHSVAIYGEGPERKPLQQLIDSLDLAGTVKLMGYASPRRIRTALVASDIFVLPSVSEGMPFCLMEAMAVGVPVVSTRISAIPELIQDGVSGYLCAPDDPWTLAETILGCSVMNEANRSQMLLAARKKIETEHDITKLSQSLMNDLANCLRVQEQSTSCAN